MLAFIFQHLFLMDHCKNSGYEVRLQDLCVSSKVASIRGTVMGAGISLVAAMDYVVAPESRTWTIPPKEMLFFQKKSVTL